MVVKGLKNTFNSIILLLAIGNSYSTELESSGPIVLTSSDKNVVVANKHFKNILDKGSFAIRIIGSGPDDTLNIEITNCLFENVRWAIKVDNAYKITIHGNRFEKCGIGALAGNSQMIKIEYNEFTNIGCHKVLDHGYGGYWAQQAAYFINVRGESNSVSHNLFDYGDTNNIYLEDIFGLWNSGGTAQSPFIIEGNRMRGGIPGSANGCGIIVGDAKGANPVYAKNIEIRNNTLVNAQSIAIGVAGGSDIELRNNRTFTSLTHSSQLTAHPHNPEYNRTPGGGITIWDYSKIGCRNFSVFGNEAYAVRSDNVANPWWFDHSTCSGLSEGENIWHFKTGNSGSVGENMLPKNMFAGLNEKYFSGKAGSLSSKSQHKTGSIKLYGDYITFLKREPYELTVYKPNGQIIHTVVETNPQFDLKSLALASGVYEIRIVRGEDVFNARFRSGQ